MPDAIENAPELLPGLFLYLQAFFSLERERTNGFSLGWIPRRAIREYAEEYGIEGEQYEALVAHIRAMDTARIAFDRKKQDAQRTSEPRRLRKQR